MIVQVGLRDAAMGATDRFEEFVPAGLAALGIEADEAELAVMAVAHGLYWPAIRAFVSLDLSGVEPERRPDLSRAPGDR